MFAAPDGESFPYVVGFCPGSRSRRQGGLGQGAGGAGTQVLGGGLSAAAHVKFLVDMHEMGPHGGETGVKPPTDLLASRATASPSIQ
jgi:hypothetical protein